MNKNIRLLGVLAPLVLSACALLGERFGTSAPFTYKVDPSLQPQVATLDDGRGGSRPVVTVQDGNGVATPFVLHEVIIRPRTDAELQSFLARHRGTLIANNAVPEPPVSLGVRLESADTRPTEYLVRVDASTFQPRTFAADARRIGMSGAFTFSSDQSVRLMALITREKTEGRDVSPNFIRSSDSVLLSTRERALGGMLFNDAFNTTLFPRFGAGGSRANVTGAWQFLQAHGIVRRVRVAIIDGGFWLDAVGNPLTAAGDGSDLPTNPIQYDFIGNDYIAGARNPGSCANPCPWHGNEAAGVALGLVNNNAAAAGTGGTVSDPMLFHMDYSQMRQHWALRTAVAWRADVVNMSFGGPCNLACRIYDRDHTGFRQAAFSGAVLVASAGNSGIDTGADNFVHPCINDGVICVGALADNANLPFDNRSTMPAGQGWASNFGSQVDVWAPTNITVMPRPDNPGQTVASGNLINFSGTSAAAPFVAGIAAMMKSVDPSLTSEQVRTILHDTGWSDSPDARVSRYVNALEAVKRAANYRLPTDRFEANNAPVVATLLPPGQQDDLNLHSATDIDLYRLTTTGPTRATVNLTYSDLVGKVTLANYGLTVDRACGTYEQESYTTQPNKKQVVYRLPAGSFSMGLSGLTRPLPYDLGLSWNAAPIAADAYEPNNTFAQRRNLGSGGYISATLHTASDEDYFEFQSQGNFNTMVLSLHSGVSLESADGPLTLEIYDNAGNFQQRVSSAADCSTLASVTLPQGLWTVRVTGSAPGEYRIWMGSNADQHPLIDVSVLFYLIMHPNVPVEFSLEDREMWFAVETPQVSAPGGINLLGGGVHMRVLTERGVVITDGRPRNFDGRPGESVSLPRQVPEGRYLIHLTRMAEGASRETRGRMASVRGQLEMSGR